MAPDYTSEIFRPSYSRYNRRMSTYKIDLKFRKSVHGKKNSVLSVQKYGVVYQQ